jgi:hypothetical protein
VTETPLFIDDPADGRRNIGTQQINDDGTVVWFKRIDSNHVMRLGSLGFDAMTYDLHFRGKKGMVKVVRTLKDTGTVATYSVDLAVFDKKAKAQDYGHGRQYFLSFSSWTIDEGGMKPVREEKSEKPPRPIVFGEVVICRACNASRRDVTEKCKACGGTGVVANKGAL